MFRKLILDFQQQCPSAGSGRKRPAYSRARAQEVIAREHLAVLFAKLDWFGFEAFYKNKNFKSSEIDSRWKSRIAAAGAYDLLGENKDYPERLLVKIEDFVDARRRNRRATEVVKESAQDKKLLEEEAATSVLKSASHSWDEELFGDIGAEMRRQGTAAAAVPKRRLRSEVEEVVSDLAVTRLRGYEDIRSLYDKTLAGFEQTKRQDRS